MRVLLDECMPRPLRWELRDHDVATVHDMGWSGARNGQLLTLIERAGFNVLVTVDQRLPTALEAQGSTVALIVLRAISNSVDDLMPLIGRLLESLKTIKPREIVRIAADQVG